MTFTYTEDLTDSVDFVRFYTGDTTNGENFLSDEIITSLVSTEGSNEAAVIAALDHIILKLSQPNFQADWLKMDFDKARAGYEAMRNRLIAVFDPSAESISVDGVNTYRADSAQIAEPDYSDGRNWTGDS